MDSGWRRFYLCINSIIKLNKLIFMKKLLIKNMVCDCCVIVVRERLEELGIFFVDIELGKVIFD